MILSFLGFLLLCVGLLFGCQRKLIYMPQPYLVDYHRLMADGTVELVSDTPSGKMQSFYIPPAEDPKAIPGQLWVLFGGNATLALDWMSTLENIHQPGAGFLLIEYPGYGNNPGKSTARTIPETADAAFDTLLQHLQVDPRAIPFSVNVLGHSLGAATGLVFASHHDVKRIVIVSPFTTLYDMARLTFGWPLCHLLLDRYDNRARLAELAARDPRPAVTIIHGDTDNIVPVSMGRELAGLYPGWIHYIELVGGDHNFILTSAEHQITGAMFPGQAIPEDIKATVQ